MRRPHGKKDRSGFTYKVQGGGPVPEGDLLRDFLDMLYYRQEEYDTVPLSPAEKAALEEGREALRRGIHRILFYGKMLKRNLGDDKKSVRASVSM